MHSIISATRVSTGQLITMSENTAVPFSDQEMSLVRISDLEATVRYLISIRDKREEYHQLEVAALNEHIHGTFHLVVYIHMVFIYFIGFFTELTLSLRATKRSNATLQSLLDCTLVTADSTPSCLVHGGNVIFLCAALLSLMVCFFQMMIRPSKSV